MSQKNTELDGDVAIGGDAAIGGNAKVQGDGIVKGSLRIEGWLEARNIKGPCKGLFRNTAELEERYPRPHDGWWALVGSTIPAPIYVGFKGEWIATGQTGGNPTIEMKGLEEDIESVKKDLGTTKGDLSALKATVDSHTGTLAQHNREIEECRKRITILEVLHEKNSVLLDITPKMLPSTAKGQWTAADGTSMISWQYELHESNPIPLPAGVESLKLRANADEAVIHEAAQESSGPDGLRVMTFLDADKRVLLAFYCGYPQTGLPANVHRLTDVSDYTCPRIEDAAYVVLGWTGSTAPTLIGILEETEDPTEQLAEDLKNLKEVVDRHLENGGEATDVAPKLFLNQLDTFGRDGTLGDTLDAVGVNPVCRFRVYLRSEPNYPMGFLDVLTDKVGITQVLTTHRLLDADGRISESSETDTDIHVWFRSLPIPSRTWSEWRPLKTEPDIEALSEEDIDEIFESLK